MIAYPQERLPTDLLDEIELFHPLNREERAFLMARMFRRVFERGDVLVAQGVPVDEVFLIASGLVSVYQEDNRGTTEVAQLGKGTLVGELSLLTGDLPNATVTALLETEVWALSHADFRHLLSRSIALALSVNRALGAKLVATNHHLTPRRTAHLTAILGEYSYPSNRTLPHELAASIARYTREPVLLVDAFPSACSPLAGVPTWGDSIEQLLDEPARLAAHRRPLLESNGEVRRICYSDAPRTVADPAALVALVTRLRHFYRHILLLLPAEQPALTSDALAFADRVIVVSHRNRLHQTQLLLGRAEVAEAHPRGLLAVTGWPERFRMGDVWAVEERLGWKVGSLIDEATRQEGVDRLARVVARLRVGIAWGGGTARGWALAGIARALEQLKVPLDFFAGTSAGALGAAVYGLTLDYREADAQMRAVLPYLARTTRFFPPLTLSRHSLLANGWWNNLIRTFVGDQGFADMRLPYAAVALDLQTGQQHVFTRGLLWQAIRASSSVPLLAPPMVIEGRAYSDGGVVNAVPLDVVQDGGADILIGIDLTGHEQETGWSTQGKPHMLATLVRTINVAYNTSASRTIPLADVLIRPALRPAAVYDVSVMDEFIEEGERATLAALPDFRRAMPWLS